MSDNMESKGAAAASKLLSGDDAPQTGASPPVQDALPIPKDLALLGAAKRAADIITAKQLASSAAAEGAAELDEWKSTGGEGDAGSLEALKGKAGGVVERSKGKEE